MKHLTGRLAVAVAALSVAALGSPLAAAQEDTITLDGLVWFDRDADGVVDPGEPPLANGRAVRVFNATTKAFIGEYGTDANGRYEVEDLPDVPLAIYNHNTDVYKATTTSTFNPVVKSGTFDFGIRGGVVHGQSFEDTDQDGVKQDTETAVPHRGGSPTVRLTGNGVDRSAPIPGADGAFRFEDLPDGAYTLTTGTFFHLDTPWTLAKPLGDHDFDWVDYRKDVTVGGSGTVRVDARYIKGRGDMVYGTPRIEPVRESYRVGDLVDAVFPITNGGEAVERAHFVIAAPTRAQAVRRSISDNVEGDIDNGLRTRDRLLPGETVEVRLSLRITAAFEQLRIVGVPVNEIPDADLANNVAVADVVVVVDSGTTPTTTPATTTPSSPAAPTSTTTTTPVVARVAGNQTGLPNTGASPFPFLVIGGLLLGGGTLILLAARRRRRA